MQKGREKGEKRERKKMSTFHLVPFESFQQSKRRNEIKKKGKKKKEREEKRERTVLFQASSGSTKIFEKPIYFIREKKRERRKKREERGEREREKKTNQ